MCGKTLLEEECEVVALRWKKGSCSRKKVQSEGKEGLVKLHINTCDRIKVAGASAWWENSEREKQNFDRKKRGRKSHLEKETTVKKRMKINHLPFLACIVLYTVLQSVSAEQATFYDALRDKLPPKARHNEEQNGNQIGIGLEQG